MNIKDKRLGFFLKPALLLRVKTLFSSLQYNGGLIFQNLHFANISNDLLSFIGAWLGVKGVVSRFLKSTSKITVNALWMRVFSVLCTFAVLFLCKPSFASSDQGISILRDSETEFYVRKILDDVLLANYIDPKTVKLYIVDSEDINAFVYGGMNVFINRGLIQTAKDPSVLYGVIAHEVGHIRGAHLLKGSSEIKEKSAIVSIATLGLVIGAIASGGQQSIDAAQGAILAGSQALNATILSFTRKQEEEADKYALNALQKIGMSTDGVVFLFKKLTSIQNKYYGKVDKYSVTHPLSSDRILFFEANRLEMLSSIIPKYNNLLDEHMLINAKFAGYFSTTSNIMFDDSFIKNPKNEDYMRVFSMIAKKQYKAAKNELDLYTQKYKNSLNRFVYEAYGDVSYSEYNFLDAEREYAKALDPKKADNLMLLKLTNSLIMDGSQKSLLKSLKLLTNEVSQNVFLFAANDKPELLKQLSECYDKLDDKISSNVFLAEYYILINKPNLAEAIVKQIEELTKSNIKPTYIGKESFNIKMTDIKQSLKDANNSQNTN